MISYVGPLGIILTFRLVEEIFQHIRITKRDRLINERLYDKMDVDGSLIKTKAGDLKVGDIVKLVNERVPADVIILAAKYFN